MARPHTNMISSVHIAGSQNHCTLKPLPERIAIESSRTIWTARWMQQDSTAVMVTTSRGIITALA